MSRGGPALSPGGDGGGICSLGPLTLNQCHVTGNVAGRGGHSSWSRNETADDGTAGGSGGAVSSTTTAGALSPELWAIAEIHRERMERARRTMAAAEKGLADLRNEARRRGVPAGVYRRAARDWQKDNLDAPAPPP